MKELRKCVADICNNNIIPQGFGDRQCKILVDVYNELCDETKAFFKDKQVYCLLRNRFRFPCKDKGNGLFLVWRKDLIRVVK